MKERRIARRYGLSLPVLVGVPIESRAVAASGKSRDISTRGIYFTIRDDISTGAKLDLTMIVPTEVTGGPEVFIKAIGAVVRVDKRMENGEQPVGVAVAIEMTEIVRNE
jgi:PilZ domain